mgnify:CR=1 FL=1
MRQLGHDFHLIIVRIETNVEEESAVNQNVRVQLDSNDLLELKL